VASFRLERLSPRARLWVALGLLALPVAAGCGGSQSGASNVSSAIRVSERDFAIDAPNSVSAGEVELRVENKGPDAHELLVVRAGRGHLPMRSDGLTVDEEGLARRSVGVLEPSQPGAVRSLRVHLTPGRYVLFCNMSGHFLGGMRRVLIVR
jgi:uncharacterized cupredoxin-like copper-binding protein